MVPALVDPKYFDLAVLEINTKLQAKFSWLTNAFGFSIRKPLFRSNINDPRFNAHDYYPAIFKGGDQDNYLSLMPNTEYGSFSFWDINDDFEEIDESLPYIRKRVGIVFWFDYRDIFSDWELRTINNVKYLLVNEFFGSMYFQNSRVYIETINERPEQIYKNYTHKEIETQFLMMPYGGLRINMTMEINRLALC